MTSEGIRRSGRHPDAEQVVIRFIQPAIDDLERLHRGDPQIVRWALKKCLHLERDPEAGEALHGGLAGFRKLTVGDRDWRVVWRVTFDDSGQTTVDVAEVWAVGARSDSEVYTEMDSRIATLSSQPHTVPIAEALAAFGKLTSDLSAAPEPVDPPQIPHWLRQVLITVVKMSPREVDELTPEQAEAAWLAYQSAPPQ